MRKAKDGINSLTLFTTVQARPRRLKKNTKTDPGSEQGQQHTEKRDSSGASMVSEDQQTYRYKKFLKCSF